MQIEKLKTFSESLAKEITERNLYSIEEMKELINRRFVDFIPVWLDQFRTSTEESYVKAKERAKLLFGTPLYGEAANELSTVKEQKLLVNRAINHINGNVKLAALIKHCRKIHGDAFVEEFYARYRDPIEPIK